MAEPARQLVEVEEARSSHRRDRLPFLPRQPDFLLDDGAFERGGGDDKNEMLEVFRPQRSLDLSPPTFAALERNKILPNGEIFLLKLRPNLTREFRAVLARIRDESPARWLAKHEIYPILLVLYSPRGGLQ